MLHNGLCVLLLLLFLLLPIKLSLSSCTSKQVPTLDIQENSNKQYIHDVHCVVFYDRRHTKNGVNMKKKLKQNFSPKNC